jgi:hypothetical protein
MSNGEHEAVRTRYFSNEAFLIGMLQAVAGASVVAALAQFDLLSRLAPRALILTCITLQVLALSAAMLAATWRYFYTLWDMKGSAATAKREPERATRHASATAQALDNMRRAIPISAFLLISSYVPLLCGMWFRLLS